MTDDAALDPAPFDAILKEFEHQKGAIIPILQRVQEVYGYLPKGALFAISKKIGIPLTIQCGAHYDVCNLGAIHV